MSGGLFTRGGANNAQSYGAGFASSKMGTSITPGASGVKGGWTELTASATGLVADCTAMLIKVYYSQGGGTDTGLSMDFGIGVNSNVQPIIPNITINEHLAAFPFLQFQLKFPISLPAGTHVWARCATNGTGAGAAIQASLSTWDASFVGYPESAGVDALGVVSPGVGTSVAIGSSAKGAWATIVSTTIRDYSGLAFALDCGTGAEIDAYMDVAIGDPKNIILPNLWFGPVSGVAEGLSQEFLPCSIPAGSTIYARGSTPSFSATSVFLTAYGIWE